LPAIFLAKASIVKTAGRLQNEYRRLVEEVPKMIDDTALSSGLKVASRRHPTPAEGQKRKA
jgi:hypothetical protein